MRFGAGRVVPTDKNIRWITTSGRQMGKIADQLRRLIVDLGFTQGKIEVTCGEWTDLVEAVKAYRASCDNPYRNEDVHMFLRARVFQLAGAE